MSAAHDTDPVLEAMVAVAKALGHDGAVLTWDHLTAFNVLLDAHAHELAERIRGPWNVGGFGSEERAAVLQAADLIDPEAP